MPTAPVPTAAVPSAPVLVRLSAVEKHYGIFRAIESLDLDILTGEFITFLGPSGSGKTTTLMMLAGFETPTAGVIEMDGRHIEHLPAHKRNIGVVFQNYALFPHMTVRQNLAFPLKVRGMSASEIDRATGEALESVHMSAMADRRPNQLSGGQQQRIALARAIIFKPRLILLDEPLGALDKNLREHLQAELKTLHRELGTTMVFVTHDQAEALTMSDRVAVFNRGRIEQLGTPADLYRRPATPFVASFIGENNMLPAEVVGTEAGAPVLRFAGGGTLAWPGLSADAPGVPHAGRVLLCLRPEAIAIAPEADGGTGITRPARVLDTIYLGDQVRLIADVDGIGRIVVKANPEKEALPATGTETWLCLDPTRARLLADA